MRRWVLFRLPRYNKPGMQVTSRLNEQLDGLEYLKSMKEDASTKITTIITKIWEH